MSNSFNIGNCKEIGCNKVAGVVVCSALLAGAKLVWNKCGAYHDPTILPWHRHGEDCPTGPFLGDGSTTKTKVRVGQQKQSKNR